LLQAEKHYKSAIRKKPEAPQPRHGLVQLYTRIQETHKLAQTLQGLLQDTTQSAEATMATQRRLAKVLLDNSQIDAASDLIRELVSEYISENGQELPPELVILQADSQIALDEREFEKRLQARISEDRHTTAEGQNHVGQSKQRQQALAQEVSATWVLLRPSACKL
jgi:hypothetical protein